MLFFQTPYFMVAWNCYCITVAFRISSPWSDSGAAWMDSWGWCIFHAAGATTSPRGCSRACTVDKVISGYVWQRFLVEVWFREAFLLTLMRASLGVALDWQITSPAAFGRLWVEVLTIYHCTWSRLVLDGREQLRVIPLLLALCLETHSNAFTKLSFAIMLLILGQNAEAEMCFS